MIWKSTAFTRDTVLGNSRDGWCRHQSASMYLMLSSKFMLKLFCVLQSPVSWLENQSICWWINPIGFTDANYISSYITPTPPTGLVSMAWYHCYLPSGGYQWSTHSAAMPEVFNHLNLYDLSVLFESVTMLTSYVWKYIVMTSGDSTGCLWISELTSCTYELLM